ncbi:MAG TPA: fumarylacetoacetate hydrolase family protein [Natronosporangium sp.]
MTPAEAAARLAEAQRSATPIAQLDLPDPATGYQVQQALVTDPLIGLKMGLTSKAKQEQVGVDEPIWGRLTAPMRVPDGGTVDTGQLIHPRIEPELAFRLGPGGEPDAAAAALEVIDSRYADFRFTLPDVIADNTSAARFAVGPWQPVPDRLADLAVQLEVDGEVVQTGSTAAILGDPRRALASGLALARRAGITPEPGWVFLAGAATAAVPLRAGAKVRAVVAGLGSASVVAA